MLSRCVAAGCSNTTKEGVSLHRFPSDAYYRRIWTKNVNLTMAKWSVPIFGPYFKTSIIILRFLMATKYSIIFLFHNLVVGMFRFNGGVRCVSRYRRHGRAGGERKAPCPGVCHEQRHLACCKI